METNLLSHLPASFPWRGKLHYFEVLDSTNTQIRRMAVSGAPNGTVVLADAQTAGRGRMGRSFHSPASSGIYLSLLLRPDCPAQKLLHLTCAVAVAAADGIEKAVGIRPGIKWTNDLVVDRKKLGGILTELVLNATGEVEYAIIGIGINCSQSTEDFPDELQEMATSLSLCTGRPVCREAVIKELLLSLEKLSQTLFSADSLLARYRADCITIGQEVSIIRGEDVEHGTALDVTENGALTVLLRDGTIKTVQSGEVSIRGMYGYV